MYKLYKLVYRFKILDLPPYEKITFENKNFALRLCAAQAFLRRAQWAWRRRRHNLWRTQTSLCGRNDSSVIDSDGIDSGRAMKYLTCRVAMVIKSRQ